MFAKNTPMRLTGVAGKQLKDGSERRRVLVLSFQLQPFTQEMAADLDIARHLFGRSGEPLSDVITMTLAIVSPLLKVSIRSAPDLPQATITINDADLSPKLAVRKDKEGPVYSATLVLISDYPSGDDLLFLMQRVTEQFFVTLEPGQGDLLERERRERREIDEEENNLEVGTTH